MFYWIKSLLLACFLFASICQLKTLDQKSAENSLHHSMNAAELKRYFGVNSPGEVPEYEITHPFLTNENGEFVSYMLSHQHSRNRRSIGDDDKNVFYHVKAFGLGLHLNVSRNENLLGHKFSIETRHEDGSITSTSKPLGQHFIGNVISHPGSTVAISHGIGMEGMIKLKDKTYFLQPLPADLAQIHKRSLDAVPHLIIKRSAEEKAVRCDQEEETVIKRVKKYVRRSTSDDKAEMNNSKLHKYLKTMYIVDQYIVDYIGLSTLIDLLPTLANIVAGIFRDDSFGEIKVNYILSKIIILKNGDLPYAADANSNTKLFSMLRWARKNMPGSVGYDFDTLTLISRGFDLGGLATAGTICRRQSSSGNIVNIAGINSAGAVAHELFHNFGYIHDKTAECPNLKYIMATSISPGPASFTWSKCSRNYAQRFLRSGASKCLNDPPSVTSTRPTARPELKSKLPGQIYNADRQCELQYGIAYKKCPTTQNQCGALYCTKNYKICKTSFTPPLDGTRCGVRHWCIEGVCVDDGSPIIDGQWSAWSDYGACSRTCGGGVMHRTRKCDSPSPQNGGKSCEGSIRSHYRTCHTQACPHGSVSFRQAQCSAKGDYKEYIVSKDRCSLTCRSGWSVRWLGRLKDGTKCHNDENILDVCVEGHCKEVGCDHNLESGKRFDRCRVCGGDGNSCELNIVNYIKIQRKYGITKAETMVTLPVHSTNVVAIKKGATWNLLGVQSFDHGKHGWQYLITLPTWSKTIKAAGTTISYIHDANRCRDRINITGPTTQKLKLVFVLRYEKNQGVYISYYAPRNTSSSVPTKYEWRVSDWSGCSRTCAGGIKTRLVKCIRNDDKTDVGSIYCDQSNMPNILEPCNVQACLPQWYVTPWKTCSLSCGKGSQSKKVICRREVSENQWETLVNEHACSKRKPAELLLVRSCNEIDCPPEYVGKAWSKCSTTCSHGVMTRELQCQRKDAQGMNEFLPEHWCHDHGSIKLAVTESCNTDSPCEPPAHLEIGCFQMQRTIFPTVLANFRKTLNYENVRETALACAKLAFLKDYEYFGLANGGECRVGPNMKSNFYKQRTSRYCYSFVGGKNTIFVYSSSQLPKISSIGCFAERRRNRALPIPLKNFRNQIDWYNMNKTVSQCAHVAYSAGYEYFGVQFYGECWTGKNSHPTYNRYGKKKTTQCYAGVVGKSLRNWVYKFE